MTTKIKKFDAVAESRKWKVAIAEETANMTREELLNYFNSEASRTRYSERLKQLQHRKSPTS